jgi:hypothetical protein
VRADHLLDRNVVVDDDDPLVRRCVHAFQHARRHEDGVKSPVGWMRGQEPSVGAVVALLLLKSVFYTALAAVGIGEHGGSTAFVSTPTIQILQYVIVAMGVTGSAYTAYRIARARHGATDKVMTSLNPCLVLLAMFGAINVARFALPVAMRV